MLWLYKKQFLTVYVTGAFLYKFQNYTSFVGMFVAAVFFDVDVCVVFLE
jgi:hypothetical protein